MNTSPSSSNRRRASDWLAVLLALVSPTLSAAEGPSLRILSPSSGAIYEQGEPIVVEAMGVGRYGGITHVELVVDGQPVAESQITFIRAPEAEEPVYHSFEVGRSLDLGAHRLTVREVGNPAVESPVVTVEVVVFTAPPEPPLLRLTSLADGTLVLVLSAEERAADVRIEASSDLVTWREVSWGGTATRAPVAAGITPEPANGARFYRAVVRDGRTTAR